MFAAARARGRDERAAGVLHRLHMDEADRLGIHLEDRLLEILEEDGGELLLRLAGRPVIAVRVAHVANLGDERLERRAQRLDAVLGLVHVLLEGRLVCDRRQVAVDEEYGLAALLVALRRPVGDALATDRSGDEDAIGDGFA